MHAHEPLATPADFGTGLRAHLGLEPPAPPVDAHGADETLCYRNTRHLAPAESPAAEGELEALAALEAELYARADELAAREEALGSRAAALLAQAEALYAEVHGDTPRVADELALRRATRR